MQGRSVYSVCDKLLSSEFNLVTYRTHTFGPRSQKNNVYIVSGKLLDRTITGS
jgi:hypothetical protein